MVYHISREAFIATLQRFPAYFLAAERDELLVGYVNGSVQTNTTLAVLPEHETYLEIENIYVQPDVRNADIGGALMRRLLEVAEQNGITRFIVGSVSKDMDRILNFYRSHGFTLWNIQLFK